MQYVYFREAAGGWRWHLVGENNVSLAESATSYATEAECRQAIEAVKASWAAPIIEQPTPPEPRRR